MNKRWLVSSFSPLLLAAFLWAPSLACSGGGNSSDAAATGGNPATGGGTPSGGSPSGGSTPTGGKVGTGGAGGSVATGGAAMGGTKPTTGGAGGTGGSGTTGGAGGAPPSGEGDAVLERNNHPSRDGHFLQPTLTTVAAAKMALDADFKAMYQGVVWGSPLYFDKGPGGKGIFIVATSGNDVYALDETTGAVVWMKNLGTPAKKTGAGCGSIGSLGIISTPVIDPKTSTLFVAGAIGDANGITEHYISALSLMDGSVKTGYPIDVSKKVTGFDPKPHNQRSALSFVNNTLYVAYGGHVGDCGLYRGRVVAVDTSMNPPAVAEWHTGGSTEAIWAPGGMASDGDGVYVVTGNWKNNGGDPRVDSEEIVHIRGLAKVDKTGTKDWWYPSDWASKDSSDADFGAVNPIVLKIPGTAAPVVAAAAKDGHLYLLDTSNLGGTGAAPVDFKIASGAMSIHSVPAAYTAGSTLFYTVSLDGSYVGCPASFMGRNNLVMGVAIAPGAPLKPSVVWCSAMTGAPKGADETGSFGGTGPTAPIATTTDGSSNAIVWYMTGGTKLMGVDGATGATIYDGGSDSCAAVVRWTSPIAVKGRIVSAGGGRMCSWSPH